MRPKGRIVAIHQPNFLPRLKVLQKLAAADIWVVLDSVQYCQREWQNRARIIPIHNPASPFWLTIPVHRPNGQRTLIKDVILVDPPQTAQRIQRSLLHAFRRAPYWNSIENFLQNIDKIFTTDSLVDICVETTRLLLLIAGRQPTIVYSSLLPVTGKGSLLIASICRYLNTTIYLSDSGGRNYMVPGHYKGINVLWQHWREPADRWPGVTSWRNISSLNYLARVGPEQFAQHLLNGKFIPDSEFDSR